MYKKTVSLKKVTISLLSAVVFFAGCGSATESTASADYSVSADVTASAMDSVSGFDAGGDSIVDTDMGDGSVADTVSDGSAGSAEVASYDLEAPVLPGFEPFIRIDRDDPEA